MNVYDDLGILIPEVYLPKPGVDPHRWAVIAVDQFTSQPEYWEQVEKIVADAPSALRLILPEIHLEKPGEAEHIHSIQATMRRYLEAGILQPRAGLIYVERTAAGKTRKGLILGLDLERYDYTRGSTSLIRATEETIVGRLPPRMKIREGAALELPHIQVLIDDPKHTVIEPIAAAKGNLEKLYDFDLMLESGHLAGYAVGDPALEDGVVESLRGLARAEVFAAKYGLSADRPVLLFAVGDGNHSLAAAKAVWQRMKPAVGMDHPARYALVEIGNVHGEGLDFEPIHRVLFGLRRDFFAALRETFGASVTCTLVASAEEMFRLVDAAHDPLRPSPGQVIGIVGGGEGRSFGVVEIANPSSNLPVGTVQAALDYFLREGGAEKIDYVHGKEVAVRLGSQPGNAGIYLPNMDKSDLFKTVILDGALPRKTFSMGEAREKRFYMEARKIA